MADKYVKLDDVIETLEHEWGYEGMRADLMNLPTADVAPRAEVAREIFEVIAKMFFEKQKQYKNSHQSGKARQMMVARFEVYKLKKKYTEPEPPKGD